MSKSSLFNYIGFILLLVFGAGIYYLYNNQLELYQAYQKMLKNVQDQGMVGQSDVKVVEKVVSAQPWAEVQTALKDTVVRIIAQQAEPNLLEPYRTPNQKAGVGTGFFISDKGEIITNHHVIDGAQTIWVKIPSLGKIIIDVELIGTCPERDLALLRITDASLKQIEGLFPKIPYLEIGDSDLVKRADEVLALGYPLGTTQVSLKSTSGVVSGREHVGGRNLIQISAPINPGSSGGPTVNASGQVVGVAVAGILSAQNVGYVIPSNELKMVLNDLRSCEHLSNKILRRPFLGVLYNNISTELAEYLGNPNDGGCYVVDVYKGSLLAQAGVKAGDVIYELNGHKIDMFGDINISWSEDRISITDYIARFEIGQDIDITVYRKGQKMVFNFKFGLSDLLPIHKIFLGYDSVDYEIYGGILFQQLTINHIPVLINEAPGLAKYLEFENQVKPALIVTHVIPNSQTQRLQVMIHEGSIVEEVNGKPVGTLQELRMLLKEESKFTTFKTNDGVFFVISREKALADEHRLSATYGYPISSFIQSLIK